jgi:hypothetical protein
LALAPGAASAGDACGQGHNFPIPNCQNQVQAPVSYRGWETNGWNCSWTGDHHWFYNLDEAFVVDNSCFTFAEDVFQVTNSTVNANFTNWCVSTQQLVVTLARSAVDPDP